MPDQTPTTMTDVEGKVAFITGGSSGIGLGIARAFLDAGMKIVITYRTKNHLDAAMDYLSGGVGRVHAINVDVTDRPGLERAADETVKTFGKVHVLVNNAGVTAVAGLGETTYADWDWLMNINLTGAFNGVRAFLPHIKAHGEGGHIVSTSSTLGLAATNDQAAYSISKFALVSMMEVLREELRGTNIGASVYCPGVVKSNLVSAMRNRPDASMELVRDQTEKLQIGVELMKNSPLARDPLDQGRLVLEGIRKNDMYILTHPEFNPRIRERYEAIAAHLPADLPPSDPRLAAIDAAQKSIYASERDRKLGR